MSSRSSIVPNGYLTDDTADAFASPSARRSKVRSGSPLFNRENRMLGGVILGVSALLLVWGVVAYGRYQQQLDDVYQQNGSLVASVVASGAVECIRQPDPSKLRTFTESTLNINPDLAGVEYYNTKGVLLYKKMLDLPESALKNTLDFSAPMRTGHGLMAETWGQVHVRLTGESKRAMAAHTKTLMLGVFLGAWAISILAILLNTAALSKNLKSLLRGVQRLSSGEFGYRIQHQNLWGELRTLADSFNDMSVRLQAYEDQNLETITFERNKLQAVLLSIADGVIVCDLSGEMIIVNEHTCQLLGVRHRSTLIGSRLQDYTAEDKSRPFETVLNAFFEHNGQRSDDVFSHPVLLPSLTLKAMVSPIYDAEGLNLGCVLILHDVTKEAEVDQLKTNFISNVSHELRTPVTTIQSYADTLYNHGKELDEKTYAEFMETLFVETERLKRMVNDILDFSRLEAGNQLEREYQDITPIINLTTQSIKVLAEQKNIAVTTALESNLPAVHINSDSIERALRNLLSNAIKYTPEGGRIKVRAELDQRNHQLMVSVEDTGIGIAQEHLPHIFDRFYRVENKVHTIKGTGLGLHLVKMTIENHHNGQVFVKSEPQVGSTFGFYLPVSV